MVKQSGKVPQVKCRSSTFPFQFFSASQYRQWKFLLLDCSLNKAMNKKMFMWLNPCHDNSVKSHKNWTKGNKLKVNLKKKVNGKMSSKAERSITLCKSDVWLRSCLLLMIGISSCGHFLLFRWIISAVSVPTLINTALHSHWTMAFGERGQWVSSATSYNA